MLTYTDSRCSNLCVAGDLLRHREANAPPARSGLIRRSWIRYRNDSICRTKAI